MTKFLLLAAATFIVGCTQTRELVEVHQGPPGLDGTSCSVAPEYSVESEFQQMLGARISCTDGSFAIILNGQQGPQGVQGNQGDQGIQGPVGETGAQGASCQAYRTHWSSGVWLACPHQYPVLIKDGEDGEDGEDGRDGRDGSSCSVSQLSGGARITCGHSVAFVYNGTNGTNGTNGSNGTNGASCSVSNVSDGARITCGNTSQVIYDGRNGTNGLPGAVGPTGAVGPAGPPGPQGEPGTNALANAIGIASYIYPCGSEFANDEIFLRLTDGKILALYDGGPNLDRLVLLAPGDYVTTDRLGSQTCDIHVANDLTLTSQLGHAGNGH